MPQKFVNKASLIFNTLFLLVFLLAEFFGFNLIAPVKAAGCNYQVAFFGTDKQIYDINDTVKFHVKVQVSGDVSQCEQHLYFSYSLKPKTGANNYQLGSDLESLVGTVAERNFDDSGAFSAKLSELHLADTVSDPSNVVFNVDVQRQTILGYFTSLLTSQQNTQLSIKVSGASIPGGGYPLSLTVGPVPDQATGTYIAAAGKIIKVWLKMDQSDVQKLTANVDVFTTVNGKAYGTLPNRDKSWLISGTDVFQEISLDPSGPLKTGQNDIAVKVTYTGQASALVASASVTIQGGSGFIQGGGKKYTCDAAQKKCIETTDGSGTDLAACQSSCGGGDGLGAYCDDTTPCVGGYICRDDHSCYYCSSDDQCPNGQKCATTSPRLCQALSDGEDGGGANDQLYNPLPSDSLVATFLSIVRAFVLIVAVFAVLFIMVGGFQMIMASGNEELYTKARKTITWAILGLVVALLSFSIIAIVQSLLKANINYPT